MLAELGINCAPDADPTAIASSGATWIRCVYRKKSFLDMKPWIRALWSLGVEAVLVGDSSPESLSKDESQWATRMTEARDDLGQLVKCWQWGNEPDGNGIASWTMGKNQLNRLLVLARSIFPRSEFKLIGPGLVSGDTNWPQGLRLDLLDACDVHPYAKFIDNPISKQDLDGMLDRYLAYGLPLWLGEYDSRTLGLSNYFRNYPGVERAAVMCWDNAQTNSEGLALGLLQNPSAMADFVAATGGGRVIDPPTPEPTPEPSWSLVEGFGRWQQLEPELIGLPAEAKEFGAIQGMSQQMTTHGILTWANLYRASAPPAAYLTFYRFEDQSRWLWRESWPEGTKSIRITDS